MNYLSIQAPVIHEIEIKKSRFICYLFPIEQVDTFTKQLQAIRKKHYKASHHCSAYILGDQSAIQKASDDGEPSGTAGVPMLEVLKHHHLTYIGAIVVRYFGGTKLGTGGLIRAYGQAVSEALQHATLIQNISQSLINLELSYAQVDAFQYFLSQTSYPVTVIETHYTEHVTFKLALHHEHVDTIQALLIERFNGQFSWQECGSQTVNIPIK